MAGVKGRSGGARPNTGGRRPGAGRKPKNQQKPADDVPAPPAGQSPDRAPLDYLMSVVNDPTIDHRLRVRAAIGAAQYVHTRLVDGGKKEGKQAAAKKAGVGRFAPAAPPLKLVR